MKYQDDDGKTVQNVSANQKQEAQQTWVKVSVIKELTGWEGERLRTARRNDLVQRKKTEDGFFYLLESIKPQFLIQKTMLFAN